MIRGTHPGSALNLGIYSVGAGTDITRQPTVEISTDPDAQYETLAKVLSRTKNAGMAKIAFVDMGAAN